jgi:glycosyltransferase involved in cell wall biosynthesis
LDLPPNLQIRLLGHCEPAQLQELYRDIPVALFPTLGDEWGLVVDEALGSGQLVLGSVHSQAVETLVRDGENGWQFDPERPETLAAALDRLAGASAEEIDAMRARARESVAARTPVESAEQFIAAVAAALESRAQV